MSQTNKHPNDLARYRRRMRFSQSQAAKLLGHKHAQHLSELELGHHFPSLTTALKLAAIYRVPVDFLFSKLYMHFRSNIRAEEEAGREMIEQSQPPLPLKFQPDVA
jgi:DNA-binding XRE family transcriptional regulator